MRGSGWSRGHPRWDRRACHRALRPPRARPRPATRSGTSACRTLASGTVACTAPPSVRRVEVDRHLARGCHAVALNRQRRRSQSRGDRPRRSRQSTRDRHWESRTPAHEPRAVTRGSPKVPPTIASASIAPAESRSASGTRMPKGARLRSAAARLAITTLDGPATWTGRRPRHRSVLRRGRRRSRRRHEGRGSFSRPCPPTTTLTRPGQGRRARLHSGRSDRSRV